MLANAPVRVRTERADLLLVPPWIGEKVLERLVTHHSDPIGAVVSLIHDDQHRYGFWLPPGSHLPAWPAFCTYLPAGTALELPQLHQHGDDSRPGWIRQGTGGRMYSRPLHLHAIITALAKHYRTVAPSPTPSGPIPGLSPAGRSMPPEAATAYLVRSLLPAEQFTLMPQIVQWRHQQQLPSTETQAILDALRDGDEVVVLIDAEQDTIIGCLRFDHTPLTTPPWRYDETAESALKVAAVITDPAPGGGYRLEWMLTLWARHYAASCGYSHLVREIPLYRGADSLSHRVEYLRDECGWSVVRTEKVPGEPVRRFALLQASACFHRNLSAFLTDRVPTVDVQQRAAS
ncbi:hypothetical protein ACFYNX_26970 [Streptomyces sp. NPDC007872]|uniref:hypothetical protein n=1 Tax=Streptomyces sp. NPDC007872 TaxID=3364782 RepID=UPI0036A54ECA